MAEIKIDKILPATGSSIALTESGKTVTIPSGATLDASAATLTNIGDKINYCTSLKTSPFTASASRGYFINTGSAVTVTLPSSPNVGDQIVVIDATGNASSNNITLGRGGSKIKGSCTCAELSTDRVGVRIVYSGSSQGWVTATSANETAPVLDTSKYVTASGGTITTSGDFKIHTFTSSDNFVVSCAGNACGSNKVSYLVVAGGAGGGRDAGGGGGAGGLREGKCSSDPYTDSPLDAGTGLSVPAATYPITVGGGGAGGASSAVRGTSGSPSTFSTITSAGGGGGGSGGSGVKTGADGGSGGGGRAQCSNAGGSGNTPLVSPPQGNDGGNGSNPTGQRSAGGGGATTAGTTPSCGSIAPGGTGATTSINASAIAYAGGGGGSSNSGSIGSTASPCGTGGTHGSNGTTNRGGGGGGEGVGDSGTAGTGGSGIVIIRYKFQN